MADFYAFNNYLLLFMIEKNQIKFLPADSDNFVSFDFLLICCFLLFFETIISRVLLTAFLYNPMY